MKKIYKVQSMRDARKKYTIVLRGRKYSCSCGAWKFSTPRKNCKHIYALQEKLAPRRAA